MTAAYRPGLLFCEMVKMDALVRLDPRTLQYLEYEEGMRPIGAQLCGSKPEIAAESARILADKGFNSIDLNCGCPVDKVTKDGSGSGLLKRPERIGEILSNILSAVRIPVTVKIRAGWDLNQINCEEIVRIAEAAGAHAICVHGRTRAQGYKGPANRDYIRRCKQAARTILVIGNGDIFDAESAESMFQETGCDGILVARGTMGQPWIIEDIYRRLSGDPPIARTALDHRDALLKHFDAICACQPERKQVMDMRRVGCWYLKNGAGTRRLREGINRCKTVQEVYGLVSAYPWEEADFSAPRRAEEDLCLI
jgi:nifR3 family TIM-barrel protein